MFGEPRSDSPLAQAVQAALDQPVMSLGPAPWIVTTLGPKGEVTETKTYLGQIPPLKELL